MPQTSSQRRVSMAIYRGLLRLARTCEGVPPVLSNPAISNTRLQGLLEDREIHIPELPPDWLGTAHDKATAASEMRQLTRVAFRANDSKEGPELDAAIDTGMHALRFLKTKVLPSLRLMQQKREQRERSPRVKFHVGQVLRHVIHPYRCVVMGWDPHCEESEAWAAHRNVDHDEVFYHVIADEGDAEKHFRGSHMPSLSLYVPQSNLKAADSGARVRNRHILDHFEAFSPELGGRYIPTRRLQYIFPDDYPALAGAESCQEDSNVLSMSLGGEEEERREEQKEEAKHVKGCKDGEDGEAAAEAELPSAPVDAVGDGGAEHDGSGRQQ